MSASTVSTEGGEYALLKCCRTAGYHTETRTRSRTVQRDGHSHVEYENYTETVTDFDIQLDASHYVQNQWTRIVDVGGTSLRNAALHLERKKKFLENKFFFFLGETMDEYANSTNYFKEITMQKQVQWDLNAITKAIVFTVRSAGFRMRGCFWKSSKLKRVAAFRSQRRCFVQSSWQDRPGVLEQHDEQDGPQVTCVF